MYSHIARLSSVFKKKQRKMLLLLVFFTLFCGKRLDPDHHVTAADHALFFRNVV